jgi:hypothetical protein
MPLIYYYNNIKICRGQRGKTQMTQLVGALCDNRTKVILVSDRMVTTEDGSLAFEHEPKYELMASNALVLTAGTIHEPELLEDAKLTTTTIIRELADSISRSYRCVRRKRIEDEVLSRYGFSSFEDFYEKQRLLLEDTNMQLLEEIEKYNQPYGLGAEFVLGGVDRKAHLYYIADPGTYRSYDALGFCCVGSGDRHAEPVFAFFQFRPSLSASKTLQIAYEAKKRAEMAGGVGKETDVWLITEEGCYEIDYGTIEQIEAHREGKEALTQLLGEGEFELKTKKIENQTRQTKVEKKTT